LSPEIRVATYTADVLWTRGEQAFVDNRYSRRHTITFDGGAELQGSSSPHVVPVPYSDPAAVDPEELLVAALSNCHMLWFLSIAAKRRFRVDRYADSASGSMARNTQGKEYLASVTLRPRVAFSGDHLPSSDEIRRMHHDAHDECYIANSVLTTIHVEPVL
jgi:organic hydroperoxide reductase OsmC/OhrA